MVRLGEEIPTRAQTFLSVAVDASEDLADQLASKFRLDVDPDDVSEVARLLASQMRREALRAANGAKFERELDEKYGVLKDLILHPTVQWLWALCVQLWRGFRLFGKPPLGTTAGVVVGLMIYRRKVGMANMAFAAAVLSGLNPLAVVAVVLAWKLFVRVKFLPKGCRVVRHGQNPPTGLGEDKLSDDFSPEKVTGLDLEYDNIVVGSDLGGLFCAALLSRCRRRVLVLEQEPLVGAGAVVKSLEGCGDWEFETGVQCLGGGSKLGRFVGRLHLAFLPGRERLQWEQVGKLESELGVHDVVSIGNGQQSLAIPSEQEKLIESFTAQFPEGGALFKPFFAQAGKETAASVVYYLSKMFPYRPKRWLDRVLVSIFLGPGSISHADIGKRSVKDMLMAMTKAQSETSDVMDDAQAALCAFFRSESLPPRRVSVAVLMGHMTEALGGRYHPRGGFRAIAEGLVEAIQASGGRVLTRARTTSILVENGRAVGVSVVREPLPTAAATASASSASRASVSASSGAVEIRVAGDGGSVVSSIGVIETFRRLVPAPVEDAEKPAAPASAGKAPASGGGSAGAAATPVAGVSMEEGYEPKGFRMLMAARPRVHLCVGLRGNWLGDLDGTCAYFHHIRNSAISGGVERSNGDSGDRNDPGAARDWYRISFGESKDSGSWRKGTTTCVVTAEMGEDMAKMVFSAGSTNTPSRPVSYMVQTTRSSRDRLRDRLLRRLHKEFPMTEGCDEFVMLAEQPRAGLSHGPERYRVEGLRAPTKLPGLFLAGEDLTISGMEGALMGGWIAAHAALGYTPADLFLRQRSLATDIPNLDKLRG